MIEGALVLAMACGVGQVHMLDSYGNSVCAQVATGETRSVEGSLGDCPTGMMPLLTTGGAACVDKDVGKAYYQMKGQCPNGSYPGLDRYGNPSCLK